MVHGDKLFISYSASATDENYCMGLLWIDLNADPLNPQNWHKSPRPVFTTSYENRQFGPDTTALRKRRKVKMCWCTTREITPKSKAIRCTTQTATRLKLVRWGENGMPDFGVPPADTN